MSTATIDFQAILPQAGRFNRIALESGPDYTKVRAEANLLTGGSATVWVLDVGVRRDIGGGVTGVTVRVC